MMGQRSQIYLKYPIGSNGKYGLIANYYQWNYAERMISRAAHAINYLKYIAGIYPEYFFCSECNVEKMRRYLDVNFDLNDIVMSIDLIKEYPNNGCVFNQENNDGRLFLSLVLKKEHGETVCEIHYCFTNFAYEILDANAYMEWDTEDCEKPWREFLSADDVKTCEENMKYIMENAVLMSEEELDDMISFPYENLRKPVSNIAVKHFKLKDNITIEDIQKTNRITSGGTWIHENSKYLFFTTLIDSIELNIGFPEDLSKWNDWDYIMILDDDFCQPYTPFYSYIDKTADGASDEEFSDYLLNVVRKYNEVMSSLDFLVEV